MTSIRPHVLSVSSIIGEPVVGRHDDEIGRVEEVMLGIGEDCAAYAVLSFGTSFEPGDRLFPVPWRALSFDMEEGRFTLDVPQQALETAPSFDPNSWPNFAEPGFAEELHAHYAVRT